MELAIRDLHFAYDKRQVLNGINLEIDRGEIVSLLGVNGCGKSTLIRSVLKLIRAKKGDVFVRGKNSKNISHQELASLIAYVPQSNSTPFRYSAIDMVAMARVARTGFFAPLSSGDYAVASKALDRIGALHLKNSIFTELSGGQKQLVLIARALASEANILVLDEPVSGLDYGNQLRLLWLIKELSDDGYTILKTTHFPDHAMLLSSRVVVMGGGKIVADGKSSEVLTPALIREIYGIEVDIVNHAGIDRCLPKKEF